ncbi:hypothetical protein CVT24_010239, partial [Panaeolus cyanescens]
QLRNTTYQQQLHNQREADLESLREELTRNRQNPDDLTDTSLFNPVPDDLAAHNTLPIVLGSPLFDPADLPTPSTPPSLSISTSSSYYTPFYSPIPLPSPTASQSSQLTMAAAAPTVTVFPVPLPIRGTAKAPSFTQDRSREIGRYFSDVELLLEQAQITTDREKINAIARYAEFDISDFWQSLPEFSANPANYQAFKDAVLRLYPNADDSNNKFTVAELQNLIFRTREAGIRNVEDIGQYHRQFLHISNFLISKSRLSIIDCQRRFVTGFPDDLWNKILVRLQLKFVDHHPDDPWPIPDVYEAGCFVLRGSNMSSSISSTTPAVPQPSSSLGVVPLKTEDLSSLVSALTREFQNLKSITEALQDSQRLSTRQSSSQRSSSVKCAFCGRDHFIRNCDLVNNYIQAGKCKRNQEGKVVLPSGAFVPSSIPGNLLKERIDEYHRLNPNQLAATHLMAMHTIVLDDRPEPAPASLFQLSADDRIASLEAELFALRSRREASNSSSTGVRTRSQAKKNAAEQPQPSPPSPTPPASSTSSTTPQNVSVAPGHSSSSSSNPAPEPLHSQTPAASANGPEHPFRSVPDPYQRPFASSTSNQPPAPSSTRKSDSSQPVRHLPPIHNPLIASKVFERSLDTPVMVTGRELLSLSPEVRAQYREATTTKRVAFKDANLSSMVEIDILQEVEAQEMFYTAPSTPEYIPTPPDRSRSSTPSSIPSVEPYPSSNVAAD